MSGRGWWGGPQRERALTLLQRNMPLPSDSIHDSGVCSPFTMFSRLTFCVRSRRAGGVSARASRGKPLRLRPGASGRTATRRRAQQTRGATRTLFLKPEL